MNTYKRALKVLEWNTILEHLSNYSTSSTGKKRCIETPLYSDIRRIKQELTFTTEAKLLLDQTIYPPLGGIRDIEEFIKLSQIQQSLKNTELIDTAKTIQASRLLKSFFINYKEEVPNLYDISENLFEDKQLEEDILKTFDENANIVDSASHTLKSLRNSYRDQERNLKDRLNKFINSSTSKYLQESVFTQRDDRYVIPVKVEHKAHVPGIVHDISSSGATVFIEPKSIVELNNEIKEIELKIENEIKRILSELTQKVAQKAEGILPSLITIAEIDFTFAKAKYSISLKGIEPKLNNEQVFSAKAMKHPILMTVIDEVIPNDIEIGKDANVLIITGSNTGGKTVSLKSTGLLTLMTKAGLHVPALEANIYPFKKIFADIGDEQSVIQSLSTFSGHMTNIINILNESDDDTLVILDEVGAGTDPQEGSSLAQAILENLHIRGTRTVVSTHYGELKALAYTQEGFENASVEFDTETLKPTYKLLMGIPGKSNAITIAKNLGLSEEIANTAQEIYITQKDQTGAVLEGLQNTQQELSKNAYEVAITKDQVKQLEKNYSEKLEKINTDKKKTIKVYQKKYETILEKARSEIRDILREIRANKSEKIARRSFNKLNEIESNIRQDVHSEQEALEPTFLNVSWKDIKIGDTVIVKDLKQEAILLSLPDKNKNVQVEMGMLKTTIKADKLAKSSRKIKRELNIQQKSYKHYKLSRSAVSSSLDLRGMRVEDALDKVEKYLDDASLANLSPVTIIHGHGTGALKQSVREYLNDSPYVSKYRPGESGEGGDGVVIVDIA